MRKIFLVVLVVAGALALVGNLLKDRIVRNIIVKMVRSAGGFDITIDKLSVGMLLPTIEISGVKILNPTNFPIREAVEINRLFIRYDRTALMGNHGHVPEIDLDLARVVMIRGKSGDVNLERLAEIEAPQPAVAKAAATPAAPVANQSAAVPPSITPNRAPARREFQMPPMRIDKLHLKLNKLEYYDYSLGAEPMVIPAQINFDQTFNNVTNVMDIANQLQSQIAIGDLMGIKELTQPRQIERKKSDREVDQQIENVVNKL
jgi:hypothetical protein